MVSVFNLFVVGNNSFGKEQFIKNFMADNYIERRMEDLRKGRSCESAREFKRRMKIRHEMERLAAQRKQEPSVTLLPPDLPGVETVLPDAVESQEC